MRERRGSLALRSGGSAALAVWIAACGSADERRGWTFETSAIGDTTVVTTTSGSVWEGGAVLVEDLAIGALEGPPETLFGEIFRLAEDGRGGVYVLDRQGPSLRRYDAAGAFLGQIGRGGEGPGEYTWMSLGLAVGDDGVLTLHDFGNQRITRFDSTGAPAGQQPLPTAFFSTIPDRSVWVDGADLRLKVRIDRRPAVLTLREDGRADTLLVPDLPGMPAERGGPYSVDTYWSLLPDGALVAGVSDEYTFDIRGPDGTLRVGRAVEPTPVRPEEAAAWTARFEWMEGHPQYRPPAGEWIPETMPPYSGLYAGSDGRVWVRRNVESRPVEAESEPSPDVAPAVPWEQPFVYDVFDREGRYLGEVRFPDRFQPHVFGAGYVWGVRRGALDEEYVVRLRLVEPGS